MGGSGGSAPSFSAAIPFDDISDNTGVVFVDPSVDFDGYDDGLATLSGAIPFGFTLFGSSNSTFTAPIDVVLCTNGWFSFDSDVDTYNFYSYSNVDHLDDVLVGDSDGPYDSFIAPFWDDLYMRMSEPHGAWYITTGTSPNRRFIVQWYVDGFNEDDNQLIFQAILFENSNDIQFSYAIMNDVDGDDSIVDAGSVNGSSATIGVMVGVDNEPDPMAKIYSIIVPGSIPSIPSGQAYYVYFKANGQTYDIYTGFVSASMSSSLPNILANRNQNVNANRTNKPEDYGFSWFYKNNTMQEFMNFVNSIKQNRK
ncbi:MAG: hypothetical protein NZM44_06590 [Candidatus Calescibacterium sp.]|nr:hypothetical protein [Candidatus Calescibacterium sp.]